MDRTVTHVPDDFATLALARRSGESGSLTAFLVGRRIRCGRIV